MGQNRCAGADAAFERAVQELSRIENDHRVQEDNDHDEGSDKNDLLIRLAEVWAQSSPNQAVSLLAGIEDAAKRSEGLSQVAAEWVKIDPEQALKLARSIEHSKDKEWALAYVARFWPKSNPVRAVQVAQMLESNVQKASVLCDVAAMCAKSEPNQAGTIFHQALRATEKIEESIPPAKKSFFSRFSLALRDRPLAPKSSALSNIAVAWAQIDPAQALRVAQTIADDFYRDSAIEKIAPLLAAENPRQTLQAVEKIQAVYIKVYALVGIAEVWTKTEPNQATALLEQAVHIAKIDRPPRLLKWLDDASIGLVRTITSAYAPLNAGRTRQLAENVTNSRWKVHILNDVAVIMTDTNPAQASLFFQNALYAANTIRNDDDRAQVLRLSAEIWAEKIPREALKLTEGIRDPFEKDVALNKIAATLAKSDAHKARKILDLPPSESDQKAYERFYYDKTEAVRDTATVIVKDDPAGADALFQNVLLLANRINDTARKATVLGYLAEAWAVVDPQQALQIADSIADESEKAETLCKVAVKWAQTAPRRGGQVMEVAKRIKKDHDRHRFQAIYEIATAWAKADFENVLAYAAETDDLSEREATINGVLLALSQDAEQLAKSAEPFVS